MAPTFSKQIIQKVEEEIIDDFFKKIDEKYNIPKIQLNKIWKEIETPLTKPLTKLDITRRNTPFSLKEYQTGAVQNVYNAWEKGMPAVITAQTGSGKTYMGTMAAHLWNADIVFALGPKSSLIKWQKVLSSYFPLENIHTYTYDGWRSCGTREKINPKQPYTYYITRRTEKMSFVEFFPTKAWKDLVKNKRVVFIMDEFHKLQKPSMRSRAVISNTHYIIEYSQTSRILGLSYTPCDKKEDIPVHLCLLGFSDEINLVSYDRVMETYSCDGLYKLLNKAKRFSSMSLESLEYNRSIINSISNLDGRVIHKRSKIFAAELFLEYIRPNITFSCKPDFLEKKELQPDYKNCFVRVSKKTHEVITSIISSGLGGNRNANGNAIDLDNAFANNSSLMQKLQKMLVRMESIKTPIYEKLARGFLEKNPNGKVAIMVSYLQTIDRIKDALSEYNPVVIKGNVNMKNRELAIEKFQQDNLDHRVFISTLQTGGESIDLHDTSSSGEYKRLILIPPSYSTKSMVQASGRVFRDMVTSKPDVRIVYTINEDYSKDNDGNNFESTGTNLEYRFYSKIREKSETIKNYHATDQESILPCNYDTMITERVYYTDVDSGMYVWE